MPAGAKPRPQVLSVLLLPRQHAERCHRFCERFSWCLRNPAFSLRSRITGWAARPDQELRRECISRRDLADLPDRRSGKRWTSRTAHNGGAGTHWCECDLGRLGGRQQSRSRPRSTERSGERPARGGAPALLGLTGVALFCLLQNVGLRYASAANTALINGAIPVMTALLAAALLGERLGGRRIVGLLISGAGVAAVVLLGTGATLGASILANVLPITGAVSFAAYAVLARRTLSSGNTLAVVAGSTRYGLLFLIPGAVLEVTTVGIGPVTMHDVLLLLYLGVGCSALAFVLCGYGLTRLDAGQGAVFGNLKPLVGVVLAAALLGESLTPGHLWGGALVLLGVLLASGNAGFAQSAAKERSFRWRHVWDPPPGAFSPASCRRRR